MRITASEKYFIIFCFLAGIVSCYDVSLSERNLKMEINKWSNFTVHVETKESVYITSVTMELNHTSDIRVSPKIVEIHTKNFSSWCHMFHVYAIKPGTSRIQFNFGNSSLRDKGKDLHIDVDVVKMRGLEPYADWCRKYYYIFSILSVYPQIFLQFLRLSVVGLDMDYVCFNFIGYLSYGIYTTFTYNKVAPHSEGNLQEDFSVTLTEIMYALHGLVISTLLGLQAIKYHGIDKRVSVVGKELISFYGIIFTFGLLLAKFNVMHYRDFLYICYYIHIASAITKYMPQLYKNYVIKSTFGWSIWTSNLELIGCIFLIIGIFLTSYNYENWANIPTDVLFWMACAISLQHTAFIIQHYFIYKKWLEFDLSELQEITLQEKISLYEQRLDHCHC
ncbi:cystinosin homolog [Anoplophora glabripennis]|uniref:cystinosin homolog n=1 Tax=Anoplophora glabripennis TaxID=217634 RepID=UPI0008748E41|nr:cystinosin homolog [Anoplophora glabripennis]